MGGGVGRLQPGVQLFPLGLLVLSGILVADGLEANGLAEVGGGLVRIERQGGGELDVAHPHSRRIDDRGDQEEAARREAGDDVWLCPF